MSKLFAYWQGPYKIKRRIGKVNYKVEMPGRRRQNRVLNINLLRKWHTPADVNYLTEMGDSGDLEDDIPSRNSGADEIEQQEPVISDRLDCGQKAELGTFYRNSRMSSRVSSAEQVWQSTGSRQKFPDHLDNHHTGYRMLTERQC